MEPKKISEQIKESRDRFYTGIHKREKAADEAPDPAEEKYNIIVGEPVVLGQETVLIKKGLWGVNSHGDPIPCKDIVEVIDEHALDEADLSDVVLNVNHGDGNHGVARTRNKTLELTIEKDALHMRALLSKDNDRCVQFYKDVSEGLLDRMSFAFTIPADGEEWEEEEDRYLSRITKIDRLYDCSAVEFPAYDQTSISEGRSLSLRSKAEAAAGARYFQRQKEELIELASEIVGRCAKPTGE